MIRFLYYNNIITCGKQEYLPVTRHGEGLSWLSGGFQLYESCLRWYLSSTSGDVTASTLHRVGRDTIDNLLSSIDQVSAIMLEMCGSGFSILIPSLPYTVYSLFPSHYISNSIPIFIQFYQFILSLFHSHFNGTNVNDSCHQIIN